MIQGDDSSVPLRDKAVTSPHRFRVNGRGIEVRAPPASRLTRVLRDHLGLTGTKVGCDAGDCGACTVLLDGEQVCACLVSLGQVADRSVTTVEGLTENGRLSRLQHAFHEHGAAQCGICTPGMLMAASTLLGRPRPPDRAGGARCARRGAVPMHGLPEDRAGGCSRRRTANRPRPFRPGRDRRHRTPPRNAAARIARREPVRRRRARAAAPDEPWAAESRAWTVSQRSPGRPSSARTEAPDDALLLRVVRSPYPCARFTLGDCTALHARYPGLARVFSAADVPGVNGFGIYPDIKDQPVLAPDVARYRGEAVAALVGDGDTLDRPHRQ